MALMIPDSIPSKASEGEKTLYSVLRDNLPDDFYVWYEPDVNSFYPDFIILGPTFGLLIIEVKGWYANWIVRADSNLFEIKYKTDGIERIETQQSPLRQCRNYFGAALDKLKQYQILTHCDGEHKGKLVFPTGYGAVMSNINADQAHDEGIYSVLEQPQVAYRNELLAWSEFSDKELINRLKEMFIIRFPFMALTEDQISTIKGILHPEMKVKEVPATKDSVPTQVMLPPNCSVIQSLDIEQEKLARTIHGGHRLFNGVAGAGKTLILLSRARYLVERQPGNRILILCFNKALAGYLRSLLYEDEKNPHYQGSIEVFHFNAWAKSVLGWLPNPNRVEGDYDEFLGEQLLIALCAQTFDCKWDSVLVDEAHTFSPSWFKCCVAALKDSESGDLMIVSDVSQSLYKRRKFTWSSVGISVRGRRSKHLKQNYRNTQEILSAAWSIVKPITTSLGNDEGDATFPMVEPGAALRNGSRPFLHIAQSRTQEVQVAVQQIRKLHQLGYEPRDIAILYRHKGRNDQPFFDDLVRQLNDYDLGAYWVTENEQHKQYSTEIPGVRIITSLSSLGLEFKAVVILWVQQFANCHASDKELATRERRQLYVAMTRSQEHLYVFGSENVPLLDELRQSQHFEVMECNTILAS